MKIIDGKYHYQVKDLIEDLKEFDEEAIIFATGIFKGSSVDKPIYKTVESTDEKTVYFYLGDTVTKKTRAECYINP